MKNKNLKSGISAKLYNENVGVEIIKLLQLTDNENGRIDTTGGDKTAQGLALTIARIFEEQQNATLNEMYLDYFNNFLTVAAFADSYEMSDEKAQEIIKQGREINHGKEG